MERANRSAVESFIGTLLAGLAFGGLLLAGCGEDAPSKQSCSSNMDCEVGYACGAEGTCVQTPCDEVPGEGCGEDDLICLETDDHPEGVCSRPECQDASDCDASGAVCNEGRCETEECTSDSDCSAGERCNAFGQCTPKGDTGSTMDATDTTGDTGVADDSAGGDTSGDGGDCPVREQCPSTDAGTADKWSSEYCTCVECLDNSHCSKSGEVCRGGTCKPKCTKECNSAKGGSACDGTNKPYCINDCCVECIGRSDCSGDKLCVDGVCEDETSGGDGCSSGSCPSGYTCNSSTGKCERQSSGDSCSQSNPNCPQGEYCNQNTGKCEPLQGGGSCGGCNQGCTCPGSLTCNQQLFVCTGCTAPYDPNCPTQNKLCVPFGNQNMCF